MTNKTTSCFVIFFIFTFFQTPALSSDLKFITLRVAPWAYHNDKGELVGFFSDFIRELEVKTGYNIDIALASPGFARINREFEAGRQDCTMTIRDLERDRFTILGAQILDLEMGVVAKKGLQLNQYEDLLAMKVSIYQVLDDNKRL